MTHTSKFFFLLLTSNVIYINSIAQSIGIGTAFPDASAKLDISSTDRGLLIPRVSLSDGNTFGLAGNSNTEGMMVYNTNTSITNGNGVGFYFWNGTAWKQLQIYGITETDLQVSSTTSNYIPKWNGTTLTDGNIHDDGTVTVGYGTPSATNNTLQINGSIAVKTTAITTPNNSTTLDGDDYLIIYNGTSTGNSITLPTATTYTGRIYIIVNHSTDVVGISTYYLDNATTSTTLAIGTTIQLVSDGTSWYRIN